MLAQHLSPLLVPVESVAFGRHRHLHGRVESACLGQDRPEGIRLPQRKGCSRDHTADEGGGAGDYASEIGERWEGGGREVR